MKTRELAKFSARLLEEKSRLLNLHERTRDQLAVSSDDLADEADFASSALNQSVALRLRDRDRTLLKKIEAALAKIETGTFGICEGCEEPIEVRRLEARPVAELCIRCKEAQELEEKVFA